MSKWDLYDNKFNNIGIVINDTDEIPDGMYHYSINTWILNSKKQLLLIEKYLKENYLNYSMYDLIKCRGEITTKEEANIIFDDDYIPLDNQKTIKSYEMEKLVALINE